MDNIALVKYEDKYEKAWDRFVLEESINGTFLQTRNFLNYHPAGRFEDHSLMLMKGNNIIAVIPANETEDGRGKKLISHMGSTFGGIVLGKHYKKIEEAGAILDGLDDYLEDNGFSSITLKMTSWLYAEMDSELLDYLLFLHHFEMTCEVGYAVDFLRYNQDIPSNFNSSRRRGYKNALKQNLSFKMLTSDDEVSEFYTILSDNMKKFDTVPLHTLDELLEFKNVRLKENIAFYGVYLDDCMVAGSMVFRFGKKVFHTQYLAANQNMLSLYPSEFLYKNLIETAREEGFEKLSFGTSTLEHGTILNKSLAQFKEGFGTFEYVNRTYTKIRSKDYENNAKPLR